MAKRKAGPSSSKPSKSNHSNKKARNTKDATGSAFASEPSAKGKKEKKGSAAHGTSGKKREYIPLPNARKGEDAAVPEDMLSEEEGDNLNRAASFLAAVDPVQMSRSRKSIKEDWKKNKPQPEKRPSKTTLMSQEAAARAKAERKAAKQNGDAAATEAADEDDEEGGKKYGSEEEYGSDLGSDDLAFGSGGSDDDLDMMSDMPDSADAEDLDSEELGDSDLDDLSDEDEEEEEEEEEEPSEDEDEAADRQYAALRKRQDAMEAAAEAQASKKSGKLPTKLPDGRIQRDDDSDDNEPVASTSKRNAVKLPKLPGDSDESEGEGQQQKEPARPVDPLGPRFGRMGIKNLLQLPSKAERLGTAKSELAALSGDIMADPENGLNLLKRLLAFCDVKFSMGKHSTEKPIPVDQPIRALALLSTLAVLLDVLPSYRIRERTQKEQSSRVSQAVARQHEFESGLVGCYKRFLEICEKEVMKETPLMPVTLKALCDLLKEKTQFNFATNIMDVIARHVGKSEWSESSATCVDAITHVFQNDTSGSDSLNLVRMLSKTIKSRSFKVHPAVLASLLHLRFGDLRVRASADRAVKEGQVPLQPKSKLKDKKQPEQHVSKKAKRSQKLKKEVEKEYAEAEMTVTAEERERDRTETLKIVFALYFRIVKLDHTSALLGPALEGLARFAHLINVDFFRDLLDNLKMLIERSTYAADESKSIKPLNTRQQLLCVVTAFELLSGQGEALNIDLGSFVTALYAVLIPLAFSPTFEDAPEEQVAALQNLGKVRSSEAHLLFRSLNAVFVKARVIPPPGRCLAFSKRLLMCALHWPSDSALAAIQLVQNLLAKQSALEGMLTTEDMRMDGVFKPEAEDPGLANAEATAWYELHLLHREHYDDRVRQQAAALLNWQTGQ